MSDSLRDEIRRLSEANTVLRRQNLSLQHDLKTKALELQNAVLVTANAALVKEHDSRLRLGIGPRGTVCIYGLRMRPFSAYKAEWKSILGFSEEILAFIERHATRLPDKPERGERVVPLRRA